MNCRKLLAPYLVTALASLPVTAAMADEVTGKIVWIDHKNSSLLLECPADGCTKIPNAKTGETYTFTIPANLKDAVAPLKEGEVVKLDYDAPKDKGYVIKAVTK